MLEIEEASVEHHGDYVSLLVKVAKLADDLPDEWREVARHYGRGAVHVFFPEAWCDGTPIEELQVGTTAATSQPTPTESKQSEQNEAK